MRDAGVGKRQKQPIPSIQTEARQAVVCFVRAKNLLVIRKLGQMLSAASACSNLMMVLIADQLKGD